MPWHNVEPGKQYSLEAVVQACDAYIASSNRLANPEEKRRYEDVIRNCGHQLLVYAPIGSGWGNPPMNPNCWKTPAGARIWEGFSCY
jgi:hypothetical protein